MNAMDEIINNGERKTENNKKKTLENLRTIRKIKTRELNKLVILEAEIKSLKQKKPKVIGPHEKIFQESFKEMKLNDEVYYKNTTYLRGQHSSQVVW